MAIKFDSLESIDVVEALNNFELRRKMTVAGKFQAIDPFSPQNILK